MTSDTLLFMHFTQYNVALSIPSGLEYLLKKVSSRLLSLSDSPQGPDSQHQHSHQGFKRTDNLSTS